MNLKRAILEAMGRDALKTALARLDLAEGVDKRSTAAMRSRLKRSRRAAPGALLPLLSSSDLRSVCATAGVDAKGRKREIVERLLGNAAAAPSADRASGRKGRAPASIPQSKNRKAPVAAENSVGAGFETQLWAAANALRGNMDAAEYKHVVLGLVFLKYISDAFL